MTDTNILNPLPNKKSLLGRNKKPTIKQVRALQYISQGMSKRQAMIKAGYSKSSADAPGQMLMKREGTKQLLDSFKLDLIRAGLTGEHWANKIFEWSEATKIDHSSTGPDLDVPDYDTQIKGFDRWHKVMAPEGQTSGVKRKLTIEEFIGDASK